MNPSKGRDDAQHIEEDSIVLLRNVGAVLPGSQREVKSIALIGSHADVGAYFREEGRRRWMPGRQRGNQMRGNGEWGKPVYFPSSPMREIQRKAPKAEVTYKRWVEPSGSCSVREGRAADWRSSS